MTSRIRIHLLFFICLILASSTASRAQRTKSITNDTLNGVAEMHAKYGDPKISDGSATLRDDRPNILFILVDDSRSDSYSVNGSPSYFQTPNIDRIANEGV